MDKSLIIQNSLKKEISVKSLKIRTLNNIINSEDNEHYLDAVEEDLKKEKGALSELTKKLNEEIIKNRRTKEVYKKSLKGLKESFITFAKVTKENDDIRKELITMKNIILKIEKLLK